MGDKAHLNACLLLKWFFVLTFKSLFSSCSISSPCHSPFLFFWFLFRRLSRWPGFWSLGLQSFLNHIPHMCHSDAHWWGYGDGYSESPEILCQECNLPFFSLHWCVGLFCLLRPLGLILVRFLTCNFCLCEVCIVLPHSCLFHSSFRFHWLCRKDCVWAQDGGQTLLLLLCLKSLPFLWSQNCHFNTSHSLWHVLLIATKWPSWAHLDLSSFILTGVWLKNTISLFVCSNVGPKSVHSQFLPQNR